METKRQGMVVWLHSLKQAKTLRKFGNVHYISKKMKYAVIYCDMDHVERHMAKLGSLPFVKRVEPSYKPFIKLEYESKIDKAKEYDYKVGF
ncbi:YlbG family protein [Bacillus sp. NPDC077027]|uniref:YlbG family protein n=1 Tax=Bacillus sp. NPDC077027 TaxID=3390548 RepID=UPI003CFDF433